LPQVLLLKNPYARRFSLLIPLPLPRSIDRPSLHTTLIISYPKGLCLFVPRSLCPILRTPLVTPS
jgi:hypothetical protein